MRENSATAGVAGSDCGQSARCLKNPHSFTPVAAPFVARMQACLYLKLCPDIAALGPSGEFTLGSLFSCVYEF